MKHLLYIIALCSGISSSAQKPSLMIPIGHFSDITSMNYSPDGQLIMTSDLKDVKIWNKQGQLLRHFENIGRLKNVSFSPDGETILTRTESKIYLWSLEGTKLLELDLPADNIKKAFFTTNGTSIVTLSSSILSVWDRQGKVLHSFPTPEGKYFIDISSNGTDLLLGDSSGGILEIRDTSGVLQNSFDAGFDYTRTAFLSPNGQNILVGGSTKEPMKLWSLEGEVLKEFPMNDFSITGATFSPNSQQILIVRSDTTASIYDLGGQLLQKFTDFKDQLRSGSFSSDGQYVFLSDWSNSITIWTTSGQFIREIPGIGIQSQIVQLSPNGEHLLRNNWDGKIQLLNLKNQVFQNLKTPIDFLFPAAFSPDGKQILLGERRDSGRLVLLDLRGQVQKIIPAHNGKISGVAFAQDGSRLISTKWNGPIKVWNQEGKQLNGNIPENELGRSDEVATSPDGQKLVTWNNRHLEGAYFRDSLGRKTKLIKSSIRRIKSIDFSPVEQKILLTGNSDNSAFEVFDWEGKLLYDFEDGHHSAFLDAKFSPNGQMIAAAAYSSPLGHIYDSRGDLIHTLKGHKLGLTSIDFSPSGKYLVSGSYDGTTRFWSVKTGQELATFIPVGVEDWVITTPQGLYDASPGAAALLYYTVFYENNIEVIALEQLKARYYEPGLLTKILGFSEERIRPVENLEQVPLYPGIKAVIRQNQLQVALKERNGGIGGISVYINGKEVIAPDESDANNQLTTRVFNLEDYHHLMYQHPDSTNIVRVRSYNAEGWLTSSNIDLTYQIPLAQSKGTGSSNDFSTERLNMELDPKLFVLTIGTSNYSGTKLDLKYADQDATVMAQAMEAVSSNLFGGGAGVEVYCFSTASPDSTGLEQTSIKWQFSNKENIKNTFKDIRERAKAEDILMVYLSGHGITYGGVNDSQFHYLTQGIADDNLSDQALRAAFTISSNELTQWINEIPALKQVLIIDACNSGQVVENLTSNTKSLNSSQIRALDRMKDRTGMFILSGSASDKVSYEASEFGQGLLTYALLQGMLGVAARKTADGAYIDVMKLFQFARDEVPRLAVSIDGVQTPMLGFPNQGASFDLGLLDDEAKTKIPIGNRKPVFIRSIFLNEETFDDDQNLVDILESALQKESTAGKDADLIYVDVNSYPKAYAVRGFYKENNGQIVLRAKLLYEHERIDLEVIPTDNPKRLVKSLLRSIKEVLKNRKQMASKTE